MKFALAFLFLGTMCTAMAQNPLRDFRWSNRLLVFSVPEESIKTGEWQSGFEEQSKELAERDLLLLTVVGNKVFLSEKLTDLSAKALLDFFQLRRSEILLIGKDGGVKGRWTHAVSPLEVYRLIDSMPMRQAEMRSGRD